MELVWETPLIERVAALVSFLTVVGLIAGVVSPTLWPALLGRLRLSRRRPLPRGSVAWLPDLTPLRLRMRRTLHLPRETLGLRARGTSETKLVVARIWLDEPKGGTVRR